MKILYAATIACLMASLSGCGGSVAGGGGGGGGPIGGPSNLTESEIAALPLTTSMPGSGTSNYAGRVAFHGMSIDSTDAVGDLNMTATFDGPGGNLTTTVTNVVNPTTAYPLAYGNFTDNGTGLIAGNKIQTSLTGTINSSVVSVFLVGNFKGDQAEAVYGNNSSATFFGNRQ